MTELEYDRKKTQKRTEAAAEMPKKFQHPSEYDTKNKTGKILHLTQSVSGIIEKTTD